MEQVKYYLVPYDKRTHCVYAHVNKHNGKIYFGITKCYPKNRWGAGSGYYKCSKFYPAIKKYGWDGFYHIVILRNLSKEEALYLEKSYISLYNTTNRDFGYNTDKGGQDSEVSKLVKRRLIQERKIKPIICLETKERYESKEDFEALTSESHSYVKDACKSKGSRVHNGMHYLYIEDYIKMNLQEIQDIIDGKLQNHQEVVCMETGEVFWDATKAGQTLPYGKFSVSNRCNHFRERGKDNFAGGFHWAFKEDYEKLTPKEIERVINLDNFKVVCLETREVYKNPIEAAKYTRADEGCIRKCCEGILRHSNNLHWMYEKDYKNATEEDIEKIFNKPRKKMESIKIKKVICLETKKVYENISEAVKDTKAQGATISKSCKLGGGFQSGGLHWMFEEDYLEATLEEIEKRLQKRKILSKRAIPVYCIETGISYRSASDVKEHGYGNIVGCCNRNKKDFIENKKTHFMAEGFHWLFDRDSHLIKGYDKEDLFESEKNPYKVKKVVCLETREIFESLKSVSKKYNCCTDIIRKACCRNDKLALGLHWVYEKEYRKMSEEDITQVLLIKKQEKYNSDTYKGSTKSVINLTTGKEYKSVLDASIITSYNRSSIQDACSRSHYLKGEIWFYKEDCDKFGKDKIEEITKDIIKRKDKRVVCVETGEVFKRAIDAVKKYASTSSKCISSCCKNSNPDRLTAGGVHWMYYQDYIKATPEEIQAKLNTRQGQKASKAVIKLETLEIFSSIEEASAKTGLSSKTIRYSCTGRRMTQPKNGHWMFKNEYDKVTPKEIEERLNISRKGKVYNMRKVKCIETGEIFNSIIEANKAVSSCKNNSIISKCCRNPHLTYKGYHWEYV